MVETAEERPSGPGGPDRNCPTARPSWHPAPTGAVCRQRLSGGPSHMGLSIRRGLRVLTVGDGVLTVADKSATAGDPPGGLTFARPQPN